MRYASLRPFSVREPYPLGKRKRSKSFHLAFYCHRCALEHSNEYNFAFDSWETSKHNRPRKGELLLSTVGKELHSLGTLLRNYRTKHRLPCFLLTLSCGRETLQVSSSQFVWQRDIASQLESIGQKKKKKKKKEKEERKKTGCHFLAQTCPLS